MPIITCDCEEDLESPINEKCGAPDFGNQIVGFFAQKMTGHDFDGTTGHDISVEADWEAYMVADGDDRIVRVWNLSNGIMPATDPNVEEGNAVPYGGVELIDQPRSITFDAKYLAPSDFRSWSMVNCWPFVRFWFVTNKNYIFCFDNTTGAGIPNVSFIKKSYAIEGIGTKNRLPVEIRWNDTCEPEPMGPYAFLQTLEPSNVSGSTV